MITKNLAKRLLQTKRSSYHFMNQFDTNQLNMDMLMQNVAGSNEMDFNEVSHNFNAGPGVLPKAVLEKARRDFVDYQGMGHSVMEMSHRQDEFQEIARNLESSFRDVMKIPENFKVLFCQGGASQQFTAVPLALAGHVYGDEKASANYLISGKWSQAAANEARKYHGIHQVNRPADSDNFEELQNSISDVDSWDLNKDAKYFFFCQNESIDGIELDQSFQRRMIDRVKSELPHQIIVSDMSSALGSRDLTKDDLWQDYGIIYAGAQKNFGTSGLTFVIIKDDVMQRVNEIKTRTKIPVPLMMDWSKQAECSDYFINTPSMLSLWISQLVCEHMQQLGGVEYFEEKADLKSSKLYEFIDRSKTNIELIGKDREVEKVYFKNKVRPEFRSRMNIPFNISCVGSTCNPNSEKELLSLLKQAGFSGLKGHRSLGGIRASMYNSLEYQHVEALCDFLENYQHSAANRMVSYQSSNPMTDS